MEKLISSIFVYTLKGVVAAAMLVVIAMAVIVVSALYLYIFNPELRELFNVRIELYKGVLTLLPYAL